MNPTGKLGLIASLAMLLAARTEGVIINEIMYHPASESTLEEYIELFNPGLVEVDVSLWHFVSGIEFVIPEQTRIAPGGYLVIAADTNTFRALHPEIANVVGNWSGVLGNTRQNLELENKFGEIMDAVRYADEGDWAERVRGVEDWGHYGWDWLAEHDGLGKSLELINPSMPNEHGQNWAASTGEGGTPGRANSVASANIAPLILETAHWPFVPRSTDEVTVTTRILDEAGSIASASLWHRIDAVVTNAFAEVPLRDDGTGGDALAGDGVFTGTIPPATNHAVVEFFVTARDQSGQERAFPPAARQLDLSLWHTCNLLYQVDDAQPGEEPLYRLIMTEAERAELAQIGSNTFPGESETDAQMNGTFISREAGNTEVKYLVGIRNRGHGSRSRKPNNYRVNFRSDDRWKGVEALNLNAQFSHIQHLGSVLTLKSGVAMGYSHTVKLLVNNQDLSFGAGTARTYGKYAANENLDNEWAENHFPLDDAGNLYRGIRDLGPADLSYRGEDQNLYTNSYFKVTNRSEDEWTDLIELTRVLSESTNEMNEAEVEGVADIDQWLRHIALMALFDSRETGLNTGHGDDYFLYRGVADPRFILVAYDLDTILGEGSTTPGFTGTVFGSTNMPVFRALLEHPPYRERYFRILEELLNTSLSAEQFDATVDQTLRSYVPASVRQRIKTWMAGRREHVQGILATNLPPQVVLPRAVLSPAPRSRTPLASATFTVSGEGVTHYRFRLNEGAFGAEFPVTESIALEELPPGSYRVAVLGRNSEGVWQEVETTSAEWVVDPAWPGVRINEVLASNREAVAQDGRFPDLIELYNEGNSQIDLTGFVLTKEPASPSRYLFPAGTSLGPGEYLVLVADDASGTRFQFDPEGDALFLLTPGGAEVIDSVAFGSQITDLSLNRRGVEWLPGQPSFGAANQFMALGPRDSLMINEWLPVGSQSTVAGDFVELFNPSPLPVDLSGLRLTDQPIGNPARHIIPPLTFIRGGGYLAFRTDTGSTRAHFLPFGLSGEHGEIALFEGNAVIDHIVYGPQRPGVSEGRTPNGGEILAGFPEPTPGAPNGLADLPPPPEIITLLPMAAEWRYEQSGEEPPQDWNQPGFDDSGWPAGAALLADEDDEIPEVIRTSLEVDDEKRAFYFRARFTLDPAVTVSELLMTHIIDDGAVFYLNGAEIGPRFNMDSGPVTSSTLADRTVPDARLEGPLPLPVDRLVPGENVLAVEVHQESTRSSDIVFGLMLEAFVSTNAPVRAGVVINEVLASNRSVLLPGGGTPDSVELFNASESELDLGGMSLSDDPANPTRFTFAPGTMLGAGSFLVLRCDELLPASATNTGFGLKATGGAVYLHGPPEEGSELLSVLHYGLQAPDWSVGAVPDGSAQWKLTIPSLGEPNVAAETGSAGSLRLNEWLADPPAGEDDWFEVYNTGNLPVPLGGLHLSDSAADRTKFSIAPLSFIGTGSGGFQLFVADENVANGPEHTTFRLSASGETLILSTPEGFIIDAVQFGPQQEAVSQGRVPDGSETIASFANPTPGASNGADPVLDADQDGLPDAWEDEHGLNPSDGSDALLDGDGDGLRNIEEYHAGTNPQDAGSTLALVLVSEIAAGLRCEFLAVAGREYVIEYLDEVGSGAWTELGYIPAQSATGTFSIDLPGVPTARFYRLRLVP